MDLDHLRMIDRVFFYGTCVLAVLRGDRPLRLVGAAMVIQALLSPILQRTHSFELPQYGQFLGNLVLLGFMAFCLIRDRRWWLVCACGFWLMCTLTHMAYLIDTPGAPVRISPYVRATVGLLWAYATVVAVAWGLAARELRRRKGGPARAVRALIAEYGEARTQAELDRRYIVATDPREKAEAARMVEALRRMSAARQRDRVH